MNMLQTTSVYKFLAGILFVFSSVVVTQSQNYIFQVYNLDNGLPQVQVPALLMDSRGYLWTGSSGGGIARFDGVNFSAYSTEHGLGSSRVLCIFEDSSGNIWSGNSEGALNRYNGSGFDNFRHHEYINTINAIAEDNHGNLLIGTQYHGVFSFDGDSFARFDIPEKYYNTTISYIFVNNDEIWLALSEYGILRIKGNEITSYAHQNGFPDKNPRKIFLDSKNNLFVGSESGLFIFENNEFINYNDYYGLKANPIVDIIEDSYGNLWLATFGNGVAVIDGHTSKYINANDGLTLNFVQSLEVDPSGGVWIGTNGGGLCRFGGEQFKILNTESGLRNNISMYIFEDNSNNIWISNVGEGVARWDNNDITYYSQADGLADNIIYGIYQDSRGRTWFGHQTSGVTVFDGENFKVYNQDDGLAFNFANIIREDSKENIWISTRQGISMYNGESFKNFTIADGLLNDVSYSLEIDKNDNVWSAAKSGVLNHIKQNTSNEITEYEVYSYTPDIPNLNTFSTIAIDNNGIVWLGSFGNGIFSFDGKKFTQYTTEDGISSNQIYSLIFDNEGYLWAGHLKGLDRIAVEDNTIKEVRLFSKEQGFIGVETALNAIAQLSDERILVGTVKGIMIYQPQHSREIDCEPLTHINSVKVFFEDIDFSPYSSYIDNKTFLPKDLVLPHNKNHITFDFVGIQYSSPGLIKYSWKLEGFDKNWSPPVNNNTATYTNLPPGNYSFKIKSYSPFKKGPSEPAVFAFSIKPPFYKTTTFYILVGIASFIIIFLLIYYRIYSLKRLNMRLEGLIYDRTWELQQEKENVEEQRNKILAQNIEISRKTVELEESNEELRIKTEDLEEQRTEAEQINKQLELEQRKTEDLLLNILPLEIANELKSHGKASVKEFKRATVMFTDFCDFINISKEYSPKNLISKLDDNFSAFDNAIEQYRIEKIKTIGDSYMCAGGLPVPNLANPIEVVLAALDIQNFLFKQEKISNAKGEIPFVARIGINTGAIIAGIIGKKKIAYDIWGETVNLASRMEVASEKGKINISGSTYEYVKDYFETTYRGKISLKNSPSIDMYFVNRIKPMYSLDEYGFTPNDKLYLEIGRVDASQD